MSAAVFVGIDVAKASLDLAPCPTSTPMPCPRCWPVASR